MWLRCGAKPSIVVISAGPTAETASMQDRRASPSTSTVQAPHAAMPQPNLVPVSPIESRKTQSSGVSSSTATSYFRPLTPSVIIALPSFSCPSSAYGARPVRTQILRARRRCCLLDRPGVQPGGDFRWSETGFAEDRLGMLAQARCASMDAARSPGHADRDSGHLQRSAEFGIGHRHDHLADGEMPVGHDLFGVEHRPERHDAAEQGAEFGFGEFGRAQLQPARDLAAMGRPVLLSREARIAAQVRELEGGAKLQPKWGGVTGERDPAVPGRKDA